MSNPHQRNDSIKNPKGPSANPNQKAPQQQQRSNVPKGGSRGRGRGEGNYDAPVANPQTVSTKATNPPPNITVRTENRPPASTRGIVPGIPPKVDDNKNAPTTTTTATTSTVPTTTSAVNTKAPVENTNSTSNATTSATAASNSVESTISGSFVPLRTHSAPPNLEEQRGNLPTPMNMLFVPDKSGGSKVPSGFGSGGSSLNSQARPFVPGSYQSPTKKTLLIIDPETGEEVKPPTNTTPPRHTTAASNPTMPMMPSGVNGPYRGPPPQMYAAGPNYYYPMMIPQYGKPQMPYPNAAPPHHLGAPNQTPKIFPEFVPQGNVAPHTTTTPSTGPVHTPLTITTPTPAPQATKTSSLLISEVPPQVVEKKPTTTTASTTTPQQTKEVSSPSVDNNNTTTASTSSSGIAFSVPNSDASPVNNNTSTSTSSTASSSSSGTSKEEEVTNGSRPTKMNPFSIETSSIDTTANNSSNSNESKEIKISNNSLTDINKKIYDRDFLLQFKEQYVEKPENLPSLNELLISESGGSGTPRSQNRNPRNVSGGSGAPRSQAPPGFNRSGGGRGMSSPSGGRRQGGSKSKMTKSFSTEQLSGPNVLEPTAGRWEPPSAKFKRDASEDQIILSKVKGYLNKITEAKFEILSNKIIFIALETIELLEGAIKLVFDKAVTEPKFCTMYAELCRKLSEKSPVFERDGKPVNFKRLLLNRCQEEFESIFNKVPKKSTPPEEELTPDDKLKMEEEEFLQKKRMLGNITFIGELYKLNMLTEKIMHECITRLLGDIKNPSHEDMEALCKLMTTIGPKLDHSKAKDYMDKYFARMKELSRNKQLPSRIRFMLQDVIALRQNRWLSKKDPSSSSSSTTSSSTSASVEIPKTKEILSRNTHGSRPTSGSDKGNKSVLSSSPDWETVGGNKTSKGRGGGMSSRGTSSMDEDDEPKSMRQSSNLGGPVTLGPQGGLAGFKGGAKGWNQQSTTTSTTSTSSDKKSGTFSKGGYSESNSNRKNESSYKKLESVSTLSIDELHSKSEEILEELFSSGEIKEAVTCVKELSSPSFMSELVNKSIGIALEKKESDREVLAKFFFALLEEEIITSSQFVKGFESVTEILEDLVIDIPKVYTYYASLVGLAIVDDCLPLSYIDKLLDQHLSSNNYSKASRILADVIRSMAHASSYSKVRELIKDNKYDITKVLAPEKRNEEQIVAYLESEKLTGLNPSLTYGKTIEKMIIDRSSSGAILDYIHERVPEGERSDAAFCREIVKHILKLVVSDVKQLEEIVNQYSELLSRLLLDTSLQQQFLLEVNDLFEGKSLSKENALSLLKSLRQTNIVKNKAFLKWKEEFGNKELVKSASDLISATNEDQEEEEQDEDEEDYEEQDYNSDE